MVGFLFFGFFFQIFHFHLTRAPELINTIACHTHKNCYPREWLQVHASSIASTHEYWRVQLRVLTSTGEFNCECSHVWLQVLECWFASTHEYSPVYRSQVSTRVWAMHRSSPLANTCVSVHLRLVCDIASNTSHLHICVYTKYFLWRCEKSLRLVGLVETETFFSEA